MNVTSSTLRTALVALVGALGLMLVSCSKLTSGGGDFGTNKVEALRQEGIQILATRRIGIAVLSGATFSLGQYQTRDVMRLKIGADLAQTATEVILANLDTNKVIFDEALGAKVDRDAGYQIIPSGGGAYEIVIQLTNAKAAAFFKYGTNNLRVSLIQQPQTRFVNLSVVIQDPVVMSPTLTSFDGNVSQASDSFQGWGSEVATVALSPADASGNSGTLTFGALPTVNPRPIK